VKILFLDTNILLHFRRIDEIDWLAIVDENAVELVLCGTVIRELDRHKALHSQEKIRRRARELTSWLHKFAFDAASSELRPGVKLQLEGIDPNIDFGANLLRIEVPDDWIIASALVRKSQVACANVAMVTADLGMAMKAKLHGFEIFSPDDTDRLPDMIDEDLKKLRKLERELQELRNAQPKLAVKFEGGETLTRHKAGCEIPVDLANLDQIINNLKRKNPKIELNNNLSSDVAENLPNTKTLGMQFPSISMFSLISPERIQDYNLELDSFYSSYNDYLLTVNHVENRERRSLIFELILENEGSSPGEDIDIFLHFPDGFELFSVHDDDASRLPDPPNPPERPDRFRTLDYSQLSRNFQLPHLHSIHSQNRVPSNVSNPTIRKTNSYDVDLSVTTAKHGHTYVLGSYKVVFETTEDMSSFEIDYQITAANLPQKIIGKLSVIVERPG
jgi:hypothetical protein